MERTGRHQMLQILHVQRFSVFLQTLFCCLVILHFYTNNRCEINTVLLMPVGFSGFSRCFFWKTWFCYFWSQLEFHILCPNIQHAYLVSQWVTLCWTKVQIWLVLFFFSQLDIIYSNFLWHRNINWFFFFSEFFWKQFKMKLEVDSINDEKSSANRHRAYPATQLLSCFLSRLWDASGGIRLEFNVFFFFFFSFLLFIII